MTSSALSDLAFAVVLAGVLVLVAAAVVEGRLRGRRTLDVRELFGGAVPYEVSGTDVRALRDAPGPIAVPGPGAALEGLRFPARLSRYAYVTEADVRLLADGRRVQLLHAMLAVDLAVAAELPERERWRAMIGIPQGTVSDGASIPRALWWLVGSPFAGRYRRAALVHDEECRRRTRPSPEVHARFYRIARADGASAVLGFLVWAAVRAFGPRFPGHV